MTQAETIMAGFDLDQLNSTADENLHKVAVVTDIDGNDQCGFFITSKNSTEYQEAARQVRIDGLKRSAKRKSSLDTTTDEGAGAVAKMIDANEMTLACSVVKGWFGFQNKGVDAPFDKASVAKMFAKFPTWKDKVTTALENETNFFEGLIEQLLASATGKFVLSEQMDDGLTLEQHLISYWKQSGVLPPQLDIPPIPTEIEYIWDWWLELNKTRQVGMSLCPISYLEMASWSNLLKINVTAFEARCIMALDSAYLRCHNEQQANKAAPSW